MAPPVHQVVVFAAVVSSCPQVSREFVEALGAAFDLSAKQRVFRVLFPVVSRGSVWGQADRPVGGRQGLPEIVVLEYLLRNASGGGG